MIINIRVIRTCVNKSYMHINILSEYIRLHSFVKSLVVQNILSLFDIYY